MEDGEELFATFLSSNQNSGEKPSTYLNTLQGLLTKAISRGGVDAKDSNKHLLRQFCRGCLGPLGSEQSSLPHFEFSNEKHDEKLTFDLDNPLLGLE